MKNFIKALFIGNFILSSSQILASKDIEEDVRKRVEEHVEEVKLEEKNKNNIDDFLDKEVDQGQKDEDPELELEKEEELNPQKK